MTKKKKLVPYPSSAERGAYGSVASDDHDLETGGEAATKSDDFVLNAKSTKRRNAFVGIALVLLLFIGALSGSSGPAAASVEMGMMGASGVNVTDAPVEEKHHHHHHHHDKKDDDAPVPAPAPENEDGDAKKHHHHHHHHTIANQP
mmetsp:Transcript_7551/g.14966  ORF Transcript_7551/g.14966 Transcript_7551/m.14966 type:complete len:146 (-) Transcript_7551:3333-3770(-)